MAWDEGRFNAALANKLKNQDIHAQVEGFNATTNRMQAATQADLLPSQQAMHSAQAQAGLMDAQTKRGVLGAGLEGRLFTPTQVNSLGLGGRGGFTGLTNQQQTGLRSPAAPSLLAPPNQNPLLAPPPTAPAPGGLPQAQAGIQPSMSSNLASTSANTWDNMTKKYSGYGGFARGGPIGDMEDDTGEDTQKAMVRPGEYLVDPHAVRHAFGGGDYHEGVRNLNRIIHNATGYEPGATYSKKGKAGFARSGGLGTRRRTQGPYPLTPEAAIDPQGPVLGQEAAGSFDALQQMGDAYAAAQARAGMDMALSPDTNPRDQIMARPRAPALAPAPAPVPQTGMRGGYPGAESPGRLPPMTVAQWNSMVKPTYFAKGGAVPGYDMHPQAGMTFEEFMDLGRKSSRGSLSDDQIIARAVKQGMIKPQANTQVPKLQTARQMSGVDVPPPQGVRVQPQQVAQAPVPVAPAPAAPSFSPIATAQAAPMPAAPAPAAPAAPAQPMRKGVGFEGPPTPAEPDAYTRAIQGATFRSVIGAPFDHMSSGAGTVPGAPRTVQAQGPAGPNKGFRHVPRFAPVEGPPAPPPAMPFSQRNRAYGGPQEPSLLPDIGVESQRNKGYVVPPVAPGAPGSPAGAPGSPAASGATMRMKNLYGLPAGGVSDFATNMVAPAAPTPTLAQIGRQEIAQHGMIDPSPQQYGAEWATRDKIRGGAAAPNPTGGNMYIPQGGAGNRPGEQMAINYGAGHGMGEGATPIIVTADATGRFNQFGDPGTAIRKPSLRMAHGGQVPHFARSGKAPFTIIGDYQDPFLDARADAAPFTNIGGRTDPHAAFRTPGAAFSNLGGAQDPLAGMRTPGAPYSYVGGPQDPFGQTRGGGAFTNIGGQGDPYAKYRTDDGLSSAGKWKKFATQDVGATAKKSVQAVREALPEAATINKWGLRGAKYLGAPAAAVLAGADIADVATDPGMTKGDVVNEVASKGSRWLGGLAGAAAAAPYGAPLGPLGVSLAGLAGGAAGYFGVEGLTKGGRALFGGETSDPSERSQGAVKKWLNAPGEEPRHPRADDAFDWQNAPAPQRGQAAGPAVAAKPSLRDMLIQQYIDAEHPTNEASGTIGAWAKQKHILDFLKHGEGGGSGSSDALNAAKMMEAHEKEIDESLRPRFKTTVKDDKGNVKETDDLQAYERFKADIAAHPDPRTGQPVNIYQKTRAERDALLSEWQERDRVGQRAKAIQSKSGDASQLVSDRTRPVGLKAGLDFGDYWGSPNIGLGDYASSFFGKGLRNQTAIMPVYDPVTKKMVPQAFPASKLYENTDGTIDLDAYAHAQRLKSR